MSKNSSIASFPLNSHILPSPVRRRLSARPQRLVRVDVHGPTPLSHKIKSYLTPRGCLIYCFACEPLFFVWPHLHRWAIFLFSEPQLSHSLPIHPPTPPHPTALYLCCASSEEAALSGWDEMKTRRRQREASSPLQIVRGLASLRASVITAQPRGMFSRLHGESPGG